MVLRDPLALGLLAFLAVSFIGLWAADVFGPDALCLDRTQWMLDHALFGPMEKCS